MNNNTQTIIINKLKNSIIPQQLRIYNIRFLRFNLDSYIMRINLMIYKIKFVILVETNINDSEHSS